MDSSDEPLPKCDWPCAEYFVSAKRKLVYAPIQKVACSSLKLWWAELETGSADRYYFDVPEGGRGIDHGKLNEDFKYLHQVAELGAAPLVSDDWFRFAFVRNPWARLVSAYVNKFLEAHDLACAVMRAWHQSLNRGGIISRARGIWQALFCATDKSRQGLRPALWPALIGSRGWYFDFTFRHFVAELSDSALDTGCPTNLQTASLEHFRDYGIDLHWMPQYRFLANTQWNFVGRVENCAADFAELRRRLNLPGKLKAENQTHYQARQTHECYADWPLHALRRLARIPDYREFYSPELAELVGQLYRRDVEQFGYQFGEVAHRAA